MTDNDNKPPLARGLTTSPDDELELRPDDNGVTAALALGVTPEGEPVALVKLVFTDPDAGPVAVTLDTRTGHPEYIHAQLDRLLNAIHRPTERPDDAAEVETLLTHLAQQFRGDKQ